MTNKEIDKIVLDKLKEKSPKGITIYDFSESLCITHEVLESSIERLRYGIFETEKDHTFKFDA